MSNKKVIILSIFLLLAIGIFWNTHADISLEKLKESYANEHSQFMELGGMSVHYRDEGSRLDTIPIVLLHGTGASLHTWDEWTQVLTQKGRRVIRMDLPAFGLTGPDPNRDYSIEAYAHFVHHFLEKLGVKKHALTGNSLGGYIAWYYATQHKDEVTQLVLIDPSGYPSEKADPYIFRLARTPVLDQIFLYLTPKALLKNNLKQVYYDDTKVSAPLVNRYHQMALREGNRQAFIDRAKTPFVDHSALLSTIQTPTLILWGEEDLWIPASLGEKYTSAMSNATLAIMPKVGHVPMEEVPNASVDLFLDFLNEE